MFFTNAININASVKSVEDDLKPSPTYEEANKTSHSSQNCPVPNMKFQLLIKLKLIIFMV